MWAVRNISHDSAANKESVGDLKGIDTLLDICQHHTHFSDGHMLESALSALVNVCTGHERNCRRLLRGGLDVLIDIAEGVGLTSDGVFVCLCVFVFVCLCAVCVFVCLCVVCVCGWFSMPPALRFCANNRRDGTG